MHDAPLLLRQVVDEAAYQLDPVLLHGLLLGIGGVTLVGSIVLVCQALVLVLHLSHLVDGDIPADGEAEGFHGVEFFPSVPPVPDLDQRFLHNILCLHTVESDAEGQSEEFILQWQDIVPETDLFHPLYY